MTEESLHHHHGHSHLHEDMLSVEDALSRIISCFNPLDPEEKPILECLGQILAEDVTSPLDLPPLSNSGMDGYAVIWDDIAHSSLQNPCRTSFNPNSNPRFRFQNYDRSTSPSWCRHGDTI